MQCPDPTVAPGRSCCAMPSLALSEGAISAHEFCYDGSPEIPPGVLGDTRLSATLRGRHVHAKSAQFSGPLELGAGRRRIHGLVDSSGRRMHDGRHAADLTTRRTDGAALLLQRPPLAGRRSTSSVESAPKVSGSVLRSCSSGASSGPAAPPAEDPRRAHTPTGGCRASAETQRLPAAAARATERRSCACSHLSQPSSWNRRDASCRARAKTSRNISRVSRPVFVFCSEGW